MDRHKITRLFVVLLWLFLLAVVLGGNAFFDFVAAPVGYQLADKLEQQLGRDETVVASMRPQLLKAERQEFVVGLARRVFAARFALTSLPLLFVLFFAARRQLSDEVLATAIAIGAFVIVVKVLVWDLIYLLTDVSTVY